MSTDPSRTVRKLTRVLIVFEVLETTDTKPWAVQVVTSLPGDRAPISKTWVANGAGFLSPAQVSDIQYRISQAVGETLLFRGRVQPELPGLEDG